MSFQQAGASRLSTAVIGLGSMGRHHVRIYDEMNEVDLVGVADVFPDAVERETRKRRVNGYIDIDEMLDVEKPNLVSVVVPTRLHYSVAIKAIERGIHVLVEKPIANTLEEARAMIDAAQVVGVHLMVGHIERFNPAIIELKRRIDQVGDIYQILARRVGPFPDRIQDVGVAVDLASHDIDAMNFLLDSPVVSIYAQTAQRIHSSHEDMVVGTLRFANGVIGALDVNWLTSTKIRQLTVVGSKGTFVADYLSQDLAFFENGAFELEWDDLAGLQRISVGNATRYNFSREEPLKAELNGFVRSIIDDVPVPAPPTSAANALSVALSLVESGKTGRIIAPTPGGHDANG